MWAPKLELSHEAQLAELEHAIQYFTANQFYRWCMYFLLAVREAEWDEAFMGIQYLVNKKPC